MDETDLIRTFEQRVAENGGQLPRKVRLLRYRTKEEWYHPDDGPITSLSEQDFLNAQKNLDAFAEYLTRRGIQVEAIQFDKSDYAKWRRTIRIKGVMQSRPDTRNLRSEWALSQKKISFAFSVQHNAIGWAVLSE